MKGLTTLGIKGVIRPMSGLGKPRSKLGQYIDKRHIQQERIREATGISRDTLTRVCSDPEYVPSGSTMQKIIKALREVDPSVRASDFWNL
ncbi:helix-turn-helix domain-containing protein [Gorillibacterium sp. sgz5001074]|uniref:helix-turn-helix domain-containing protein n=1 Tax=Gorillibacterium sp. sgz5001074 TaxID=3446695 RepID=UPI003F675632